MDVMNVISLLGLFTEGIDFNVEFLGVVGMIFEIFS